MPIQQMLHVNHRVFTLQEIMGQFSKVNVPTISPRMSAKVQMHLSTQPEHYRQ